MHSKALVRIALQVGRLERVALLPTFDEWVSKKKFKNPNTKKDVSFNTYEKQDPGGAKKVREKFNNKVQQWQVQDDVEGHGIPKSMLESQATWQSRIKDNQADVENFRKEELTRIFDDDIKSLLENIPSDDAKKVKDALKAAGVEETESIGELNAATASNLDAELSALGIEPAKAKFKTKADIRGDTPPGQNIEDNLTAFLKIFGNSPDEGQDLLISIAIEQANKVKDLEKKLGELKKAVNDTAQAVELQKSTQALIDELEASDKVAEAHKVWRKQNAAAARLQDLAQGAKKQAQGGSKAKPSIKMPPPPKAQVLNPKPKEEKPSPDVKPKTPKKPEVKKPGDIWGKKPKLYALNSKGEQGGPFKGMNEAKRWSKGKSHTPKQKAKAEKTRSDQQKAKGRKKRGVEELVRVLATNHVLGFVTQ